MNVVNYLKNKNEFERTTQIGYHKLYWRLGRYGQRRLTWIKKQTGRRKRGNENQQHVTLSFHVGKTHLKENITNHRKLGTSVTRKDLLDGKGRVSFNLDCNWPKHGEALMTGRVNGLKASGNIGQVRRHNWLAVPQAARPPSKLLDE